MDYSSDGSLSSTVSHSDQGQALSSQAPQSYGASLTHRPAPMQPTLNVQPLTPFASSAAYMTAKSAPTGTRNNMAHNQQPGTLNAPINNSATSSHIQQPAAAIENNLLDWCKAQGYVSHDIQLLPPSKKSSEKWALGPFLALQPIRHPTRGGAKMAVWRPGKTLANWYALFVQVAGTPAPKPCLRCSSGRGLWAECIVAPTSETDKHMRGACACCCMNNQSSTCSLYKSEKSPRLAQGMHIHCRPCIGTS